jgi:hypothetical protein
MPGAGSYCFNSHVMSYGRMLSSYSNVPDAVKRFRMRYQVYTGFRPYSKCLRRIVLVSRFTKIELINLHIATAKMLWIVNNSPHLCHENLDFFTTPTEDLADWIQRKSIQT